MTREEMGEKLRDLAWREREYLAAVLDDTENPHVIAQWLEEAAGMLKDPLPGTWLLDRPNHYKCSVCGAQWGQAALMMRHCPDCERRMEI